MVVLEEDREWSKDGLQDTHGEYRAADVLQEEQPTAGAQNSDDLGP